MQLSWQIVRLNLKETFSISYGNYDCREALIVSLKSHHCIGYGECTAIDYYQINLNDFVLKLNEIQSKIESQKIIHPKDFYHLLIKLNLPSFLRSALDCAFWDLFGKLENQSFLQLNEIEIKHLPESSITISVDSVENQIQKIKKSSWNQFKVKCNRFNLLEIKSLVALDYKIALDSNGSFKKENCQDLEAFSEVEKFLYLEQPMPKGIENYEILNSNSKANWMADEDSQDINSLKQLQLHYKSINIKLVKCGGLTPALELISEARKVDFKIMIGCMTESTIGISADVMLAPFCDYADLDGANLIANDIAKGSHIEEGKILISEKPGLGISIV